VFRVLLDAQPFSPAGEAVLVPQYERHTPTPFSSGQTSASHGVLLVDYSEAVNTGTTLVEGPVQGLGGATSPTRLVPNTVTAVSSETSASAVHFFSSPPSADWECLQPAAMVSGVNLPTRPDSPSSSASSLAISDSPNSNTAVADEFEDVGAAVRDVLSTLVDNVASNEAQSHVVDQCLDELLGDVSAAADHVQGNTPADLFTTKPIGNMPADLVIAKPTGSTPAVLSSGSHASPDSSAESQLVLTGSTARPALAEVQLPVTSPGSSGMVGSLVKARPSMAKVQRQVKAGAAASGLVRGSEWWQHKSLFQEMAAAVPTQHSQVTTQISSLLWTKTSLKW